MPHETSLSVGINNQKLPREVLQALQPLKLLTAVSHPELLKLVGDNIHIERYSILTLELGFAQLPCGPKLRTRYSSPWPRPGWKISLRSLCHRAVLQPTLRVHDTSCVRTTWSYFASCLSTPVFRLLLLSCCRNQSLSLGVRAQYVLYYYYFPYPR